MASKILAIGGAIGPTPIATVYTDYPPNRCINDKIFIIGSDSAVFEALSNGTQWMTPQGFVVPSAPSIPLRVATVYNILAYATATPGAETDSYLAMPFIVAGARTSIAAGDYCWMKTANLAFGQNQSSDLIGNGFMILQAAFKMNGVSVPAKWAGSRSTTVADGTPSIISDEISGAAFGFAGGIIPDGTIGWYCVEKRLPSTSAKIGTTDKYLPIYDPGNAGSSNYPWQCISYNPANSTLSSIDAVNPLRTVTGTAATVQNKWSNPIILGRPVSDVTQVSHLWMGDSITQGVNDDTMPAIYGVGYGGRTVQNLPASKIPSINFGVTGRYTSQQVADSRTIVWYQYCKTASIMLMTNDYGLGRTTGVVALVWAAEQQIVTDMKSQGVQKILRFKVPPYTTGVWDTEAQQIVGLNYTSGSLVDQHNALIDASVGMYSQIINPTTTQGTDPRKWYSAFGASTPDGIHPKNSMSAQMGVSFVSAMRTFWGI